MIQVSGWNDGRFDRFLFVLCVFGVVPSFGAVPSFGVDWNFECYLLPQFCV